MNKKQAEYYFSVKEKNKYLKEKGSQIRYRVEKDRFGDYELKNNTSDLSGSLPEQLTLLNQLKGLMEDWRNS